MNSLVEYVTRKDMSIKPSGRSTDFITPSFGFGCLFECSYCYCKRNVNDGIKIATNVNEILTEIDHYTWFAVVDKPNQTHDEFITWDLSCNEDFSLHLKYHQWEKIFDFFVQHPKAMGSFATKYVNPMLLTYNPNKKIRIRFSLMPDKYSKILEPNTSSIDKRIESIDKFIEAGYDVHINFSPVIVTDGWLDEYRILFNKVNDTVVNKDKVKAEVIFLTHNNNKHQYNIDNNIQGEDLLWKPEIQEDKVSQYGSKNIRYKHKLKSKFIKQWTDLHDEIIPWNTIRYIF